MILNGVIFVILCYFTETLTFGANYVTAVEVRLIMSKTEM